MINDPNYVPYPKVVGEANRGDSAYGPGANNFIKDTPLDAKSTVQMGKPSIGDDYAFRGITKSASVTGPVGEVETTYDHANLSRKYKYPQISQDTVPQAIPLDTIQSQE